MLTKSGQGTQDAPGAASLRTEAEPALLRSAQMSSYLETFSLQSIAWLLDAAFLHDAAVCCKADYALLLTCISGDEVLVTFESHQWLFVLIWHGRLQFLFGPC